MFGDEQQAMVELVGCNRPHDPRGTGTSEFFAGVTMKDVNGN